MSFIYYKTVQWNLYNWGLLVAQLFSQIHRVPHQLFTRVHAGLKLMRKQCHVGASWWRWWSAPIAPLRRNRSVVYKKKRVNEVSTMPRRHCKSSRWVIRECCGSPRVRDLVTSCFLGDFSLRTSTTTEVFEASQEKGGSDEVGGRGCYTVCTQSTSFRSKKT